MISKKINLLELLFVGSIGLTTSMHAVSPTSGFSKQSTDQYGVDMYTYSPLPKDIDLVEASDLREGSKRPRAQNWITIMLWSTKLIGKQPDMNQRIFFPEITYDYRTGEKKLRQLNIAYKNMLKANMTEDQANKNLDKIKEILEMLLEEFIDTYGYPETQGGGF